MFASLVVRSRCLDPSFDPSLQLPSLSLDVGHPLVLPVHTAWLWFGECWCCKCMYDLAAGSGCLLYVCVGSLECGILHLGVVVCMWVSVGCVWVLCLAWVLWVLGWITECGSLDL